MSTSSVLSTETPITPPRRSGRIWLLSMAGTVVLVAGWIGYVAMLNSRVRAEQLGAYQAAQYRDQMRMATPNGTGQTFATQRFAQNSNPNSQQGNTYSSNIPVVQQNNLQYQQNQPGYYISPTPAVDRAEVAAAQAISELSTQLRTATGEQKKTLRKSLTEAVGKLFDLRHAAQAKQVEKLESELAEAKELLKKRSERKDEIVDRRIAELLQSADDLAWNRGIANPPVPATNYALPPNGYPQPLLPNSTYNTAPNGSYPNYSVVPNPYNTAPTYSPGTLPGTLYSNPVPPSSTRPQLIPMLTPDSGQSSLLETAPRINVNTYSAPSAPSATSPAPTSSQSFALPLLNAQPEEAARLFVTYLQEGNTQGANQLLTSKAQQQLAQANFQLMQIPDAKFEIGGVGYSNKEKSVALVEATLSMTAEKPLEAVIECHLENGGWFIAGIAIQANDQTIAFDFEDAASLTKMLTLDPDLALPEIIEIAVNNAKLNRGASAEEKPQPMETQPSTSSSTSSNTKFEYSKAVIEAAYNYEESLQAAVEGGLLWKKGLTNSNEYASRKRKAAKAKTIWVAISRDIESQISVLVQDLSGKSDLLGENSTKAKQAELKLEISKLESELRSLTETRVWAEDFKKQSLESLEKQLEQSDEKKLDTKADPKTEGENPNE